MITIPDRSLIAYEHPHTPKNKQRWGPEYGYSVGSSPITRLHVEEDFLDGFVWEFVRHLSCPPPMVICRINPEIHRNGIRD